MTPPATAAADPAAPSRAKKAFRSPLAVYLFLGALGIGLVGDLLSKHYVFESLLADPVGQQQAIETYLIYKAQKRTLETRDVLGCFQTRRVLGVCFKLQTNKGVVFGTELHPSQSVHRLIVACVSVLLVGMVGVFFATSESSAWMAHLALGAVLAGALGNLYDRLWGSVQIPPLAPAEFQVRDFIDCSALGYPWVFNVADILLVVGVGALAVHWLLASRRAKRGV
ncbi:MAG: signal peptidase II [Planctomycetota bacterium]|nr:signal peptidase II [Planctomycetota bacterium]